MFDRTVSHRQIDTVEKDGRRGLGGGKGILAGNLGEINSSSTGSWSLTNVAAMSRAKPARGGVARNGIHGRVMRNPGGCAQRQAETRRMGKGKRQRADSQIVVICQEAATVRCKKARRRWIDWWRLCRDGRVAGVGGESAGGRAGVGRRCGAGLAATSGFGGGVIWWRRGWW